ncbi:MarR family transcriptional regulator [Mesorhizobium sp. VK23B]|uniref:MarR family transcriptional regulator n=1 Tax=Mesorhizobium dulcispinae TaxID=3072316 RepID=A0ABU4XPK6_9HYPH|nr:MULTISPECIES: MarR family transcriptional regulator [unclassified Mesorhizobium]MDX8470265.1 MarR family transcriptional regulator [Mesorhizobium sp. VK23B]MDX8476680.1 MarR family transcriptional regulator [Mesorhizobium sp. VK23A]
MATKPQILQDITSDLLLAGRRWRRAAGRLLGSHGTSDAAAAPLISLAQLGNGARQIDIASDLGIESPSLVRLINQLEAQGLVERQCDDSDRRANGLFLTEQGQETAEQLQELLADLRGTILGKFTKAELETAARVLKAFEDLE